MLEDNSQKFEGQEIWINTKLSIHCWQFQIIHVHVYTEQPSKPTDDKT